MKKLWNDIKGAKKLLCTLCVLIFLLGLILTVNRISSVMEPGDGEGYATLYVSPASNSFTSPPTTVGDKFTVEVRIFNYSQVAGFQVKLAWDASLINVASTADVSYATPADFIFPPGSYSPVAPSIAELNATHWYVMITATAYEAVEYSGTDAGLIRANFTIISLPSKGVTSSCVLWLEPVETYTLDENIDENDEERIDGYYEITSTVANHLEVSPTDIALPVIAGDKIVGTDEGKFSVDILIMNISASDDLILVQFEMNYDNTVLNCTDVVEGTFMNNPTWAPYGTFMGWIVDELDGLSKITFFVMINPNSTPPNAGEWNWVERPNGSGTLATIHFEIIHQPFAPESVSFPLELAGVFGEFFLNSTPEYVPYGPPINATFTLNGYNYREPVAAFTFPEPVEVNKTVTFDASASYGWRNVDGALVLDSTYIKEYIWDWGDGNTNTTATPVITHTYSDFGLYTVNLTVIDYDELTNSTTRSFLAVEVVSHTVTYDVDSFTVVTVSTGKIKKDSIVLIQKHRCLYFNITGKTGTLAIINITIPTALLNAAPEDWMVVLPMEIITTESGLIVTQVNSTHVMLSITFTFQSEEPILIFGTHVIPEFSGSTLALVFMAMSMVAVMSLAISKKRKK